MRGRPRLHNVCRICQTKFPRKRTKKGRWDTKTLCPACHITPNRLAVASARATNPCATLTEIGLQIGIGREAARQLLVKENLPTKAYRQKYLCLNCGTEMPKKALFCSAECHHEYTHIKVTCTWCGELFEYNAKLLIWKIRRGHKMERLFCSKQCQGKWMATNYGFGMFPEHRLYHKTRCMPPPGNSRPPSYLVLEGAKFGSGEGSY